MAIADLNQLKIEANLEDGDLITDAILLMRVARVDKDGSALVIASTPGVDWITQLGMVEAARTIMHDTSGDDDDDED